MFLFEVRPRLTAVAAARIPRAISRFSPRKKSPPCPYLKRMWNKSGRFFGGIAADFLPPIAAASDGAELQWTLEESAPMPWTEPMIDLQSDHYFMGEALRQAAQRLRSRRDAGRRGHRAGRAHHRPGL